jgi:hypothetical protein
VSERESVREIEGSASETDRESAREIESARDMRSERIQGEVDGHRTAIWKMQ